jgi:hypothetical protein
MIFLAFSQEIPHTILSGVMKSLIAAHSLRNSGFDTISNSIFSPLFLISSRIISAHISPVPTGTVDLLIKTLYVFTYSQNVFATDFTKRRSAL